MRTKYNCDGKHRNVYHISGAGNNTFERCCIIKAYISLQISDYYARQRLEFNNEYEIIIEIENYLGIKGFTIHPNFINIKH